MAKAKKGKSGGSSKPTEMLLVSSKVRQMIKDAGCNTAGDALDGLNNYVGWLVQQAANNSKQQFANSPDLKEALIHAIMDSLEAHSAMSSQALGSERVRDGLRDILLGPAQLYEALRARGEGLQVNV